MLETQRHSLILDMLDEHGSLSVRAFVEETGVSEATIRRDLIKLAERGKLKQVRGGAMLANAEAGMTRRRHLAGSAFLASMGKEVEAKRAIAELAVSLCDDGDAVIVNGGSTTFHMAEYLRRSELNILTNSLALGVDLIENSNNRVIFPAGEAHRKLSFILNPLEDAVTDAFRASKYFLSACAVSAKGVMEADPLVAAAEQRFARQADEIVLMIDATKVGRNSSYAAFELDQIDKVITDDRLDREGRKLFADHGVEVLIARRSDGHAKAERSA